MIKSAAQQLAAKKSRSRLPRNRAGVANGVWACRVREFREALNLSLLDVARSIGMSVTGLWQIEMGNDPMLTTAAKIAAFYDVPINLLWPTRRSNESTR